MARFVIAVSVVSLVFGSSCGAPNRPDAGTTGGGLSGAGGGLSGTGGGSTAGGSGAGGTAGGATAGCIMVPSVAPNQFFFGQYNAGLSDGGGLQSFGAYALVDADRDAGIGVFAHNELYWDNGTPMPTFPRTFTLTGESYAACYNCMRLLVCQLNDPDTCFADGFMAQSGSGSFTSGVFNPMRGSFAGTATNVRYVAWDFGVNPDRARDGGCIQIGSQTWNIGWDAG
jgi:hypothetical protein